MTGATCRKPLTFQIVEVEEIVKHNKPYTTTAKDPSDVLKIITGKENMAISKVITKEQASFLREMIDTVLLLSEPSRGSLFKINGSR